MEYSKAGGKLIQEKNQKQKISWHCPFNWEWPLGYVGVAHGNIGRGMVAILNVASWWHWEWPRGDMGRGLWRV